MKMLTSFALSYVFLGLSSQLMAIVPPVTLMCPTVYQPARCSYEEYSAEGSNRCFAWNDLKQILARHGVDVKPELIRCESTDVAFLAPVHEGPEEVSEDESEVVMLRNPAINLVPCVFSKLDPEGPFERPGLCRNDLHQSLIHVRISPCIDQNPYLCAEWIKRKVPRIERSCESQPREIATAIISCLNVHPAE